MENTKRNKPTIYDVAKLANTSIATVSRVLGDADYPVTMELKKRVLQAAEELYYVPNLLGRQLKTNKSMDIAVIIPNISNPFYPELVLGIEDAARMEGYHVLLCSSHRDLHAEQQYITSMLQKEVKGVIIASQIGNIDFIQKIQGMGLNIVAIEQNLNECCNSIYFDYFKAGFMAAEHLINLRHKDIGFIGSPLTRENRISLYQGFVRCLKDHNLLFREEFCYLATVEKESHNGIYEFDNGRNMARQMIGSKNRPTAVFCNNDITAIGVMHELLNSGMGIPGDVSVVGFDNIFASQITHPPLTTIDQSTYEMGKIAAQVLIGGMKKQQTYVSHILKPKLVERASTREL